ncbi:MAG: histidine kinase dimerization/phospho-acceptor domain-containing protein [Anaerolineae bacterium]
MDSLFNGIVSAISVLYVGLLVYVQVQRTPSRSGRWWLTIMLIFGLAASLLLLTLPTPLPTGKYQHGFLLSILLIGSLTIFGSIVLKDVQRENNGISARIWAILGSVWLIIFAVSGGLSETLSIGDGTWIVQAFNQPTAAAWVLLGGFGITTIVLLGLVFIAFYSAQLPEVANRALYWVVTSVAVLVGCLLLLSGTRVLVLVGNVALLMGSIGTVYANVSYQIVDIRSGVSRSLRTILFTLLIAGLVFFALYFVNRLGIPHTLEGNLVLVIIALAVAVVYTPARKLTELVLNPILRGTRANTTQVTRQYSQQVSKSVELDVLTSIVRSTLNTAMGVRRSGMLLVKHSEGGKVVLLAAPGSFTDVKERSGVLYIKSPVYQQFATQQVPLSQFDIEYHSRYSDIPAIERDFLRQLQTSAYAPIIVDEALIGILACGAKVNDAPYYPHDLELLATLANQTGVALRNATLVADLRRLNSNMTQLNNELNIANQQMGKLDAVKTDFVTIASHELRTPLAQIRGYIDIADALNEQEALDKDQAAGLIENLRKATERMDDLIGAMLDVSQIDVNALNLHFETSTIEQIVRSAIEPLSDAIKQRKLSLSARGLKGLPALEADPERLMQAFRNVVVNAIKFTPDGGKIDVVAYLYPPDRR